MPSKPTAIAREINDVFCNVDEEIPQRFTREFEKPFREHEPTHGSEHFAFVELETDADFEKIPKGRGVYLIVGDVIPNRQDPNMCKLSVNGCPVLYRGQAYNVKECAESHLHNRRYIKTRIAKNQGIWTRCIKLDEGDGDGGIDFGDEKYRDCYWEVLSLPMPKSTTVLRQYVEWGFDRVFGKPIASNERKQATDDLEEEPVQNPSERYFVGDSRPASPSARRCVNVPVANDGVPYCRSTSRMRGHI
jgi:hypothetical protein